MEDPFDKMAKCSRRLSPALRNVLYLPPCHPKRSEESQGCSNFKRTILGIPRHFVPRNDM
jgi:hypothetical protein